MLSLDGGGVRSVLSIPSLIVVEDAIKTYIKDHKSELLPTSLVVSSIDDFDVYLADYFDVLTGSASGGWVASYLGSKGADGSLRSVLQEQEVITEYGFITPGTAKALLVFFNKYSATIYPQSVPVAPTPDSDPVDAPTAASDDGDTPPAVIPGINAPRYSNAGLFVAMEALFGEGTLEDLTTTCLIPMLDLETGTVVTMVSDHLKVPSRIGYTDFMFTNDPPALVEPFVPDVMFNEGSDFKLETIGVATGSAPILFPAINVSSVSGPAAEFLGFDGFLGVAGNPTFLALAYTANRLETSSLEKFAILTIGAGAQVGEYEDNAAGGIVQWFASQELLQIILFLAGSDFSSQLDLLFYANPRVQFGQYLRIQTFADSTTPEGPLLGVEDQPANVAQLQTIGQTLAADYTESITSFVEDFLFG